MLEPLFSNIKLDFYKNVHCVILSHSFCCNKNTTKVETINDQFDTTYFDFCLLKKIEL